LPVGFGVACVVTLPVGFGVACVVTLPVGFGVACGDLVGVNSEETLLQISFPKEFFLHTTRLFPSTLVELSLSHLLPVFTAIAEYGKDD
jgi:hypothetical protein